MTKAADKSIDVFIQKCIYAAYADQIVTANEYGYINNWSAAAYQTYANLCTQTPEDRLEIIKWNPDFRRVVMIVWDRILSEFAAVDGDVVLEDLIETAMGLMYDTQQYSYVMFIDDISGDKFGKNLADCSDTSGIFRAKYLSVYANEPAKAARADIIVGLITKFIKALAATFASINRYISPKPTLQDIIGYMFVLKADIQIIDDIWRTDDQRRAAAKLAKESPKPAPAPKKSPAPKKPPTKKSSGGGKKSKTPAPVPVQEPLEPVSETAAIETPVPAPAPADIDILNL